LTYSSKDPCERARNEKKGKVFLEPVQKKKGSTPKVLKKQKGEKKKKAF